MEWPILVRHIQARIFGICEGHLANNKWFVGDTPTLADVQMSLVLERLYLMLVKTESLQGT